MQLDIIGFKPTVQEGESRYVLPGDHVVVGIRQEHGLIFHDSLHSAVQHILISALVKSLTPAYGKEARIEAETSLEYKVIMGLSTVQVCNFAIQFLCSRVFTTKVDPEVEIRTDRDLNRIQNLVTILRHLASTQINTGILRGRFQLDQTFSRRAEILDLILDSLTCPQSVKVAYLFAFARDLKEGNAHYKETGKRVVENIKKKVIETIRKEKDQTYKFALLSFLVNLEGFQTFKYIDTLERFHAPSTLRVKANSRLHLVFVELLRLREISNSLPTYLQKIFLSNWRTTVFQLMETLSQKNISGIKGTDSRFSGTLEEISFSLFQLDADLLIQRILSPKATIKGD